MKFKKNKIKHFFYNLSKKIWVRIIFYFILAFIILGIIFVVSFNLNCSSDKNKIYYNLQHQNYITEIEKLKSEIEGYARTEESTYLTFPEWYTVYSYKEYADFIMKSPPSQFPYFLSIKQYWGSYCKVHSLTKRNYPFNAGNHLMLSVVGTSFSVEYGIKGLYEKTIGRLTEYISYNTSEDKYASKIAFNYWEFILERPWYEFKFGNAVIGIWKENSIFGDNFIRKLERKTFFTIENVIKELYAGIIKLGTRAFYGTPDELDYLWIKNISSNLSEIDSRIKIIKEMENNSYVISVPHYQPFTEILPKLSNNGAVFIDISGADYIAVSILVDRDWNYSFSKGSIIFEMIIPTNNYEKRVVINSPVSSLNEILIYFKENNATIEHIYDY